jgi:hypothetical protein
VLAGRDENLGAVLAGRDRVPPIRSPLTAQHQTGRYSMGGISLGGILVIIGIVVAIFWSVWLGLIIALIGLIAFGGFARGRWY